jgi:chemotaxis signal transduction protein
VINLHGQVIPVIDLRLRCGLGFVWRQSEHGLYPGHGPERGSKILLDIDRVLYEENASTIQLAA